MAQRVQEESAEQVLRLMVRVSSLTLKAIIAALDALYRKLENKEPVGQTQLKQLMLHDAKIETTKITARDAASLEKEMQVFDRMARRFGVGYSIVKIPDQPGYIIFFRARQMEQVSALLSEFMRHKFWREAEAPGGREAPTKEREAAAPGRGHGEKAKESIETKLARARVKVAQEAATRQPAPPTRGLER